MNNNNNINNSQKRTICYWCGQLLNIDLTREDYIMRTDGYRLYMHSDCLKEWEEEQYYDDD